MMDSRPNAGNVGPQLLAEESISRKSALGRKAGIAAGLAWDKVAAATVVYTDRGISDGMHQGVARAQQEGRSVEYRRLRDAGDRRQPTEAAPRPTPTGGVLAASLIET